MSKATHIKLQWAGGLHRFHIDFTEKHPGKVDFTPGLHDRVGTIFDRLTRGTYGADDVANPIRLGLIYGGDFVKAKSLVNPWPSVDQLINKHVLSRPLAESVPLAQTVLLAALVGVDPALADQGLDPVAVDLGEASTAAEA